MNLIELFEMRRKALNSADTQLWIEYNKKEAELLKKLTWWQRRKFHFWKDNFDKPKYANGLTKLKEELNR